MVYAWARVKHIPCMEDSGHGESLEVCSGTAETSPGPATHASHAARPSPRRRRDDGLSPVYSGIAPSPQHPDEHRPEHPILFAVALPSESFTTGNR
jgi:hypothetical protein